MKLVYVLEPINLELAIKESIKKLTSSASDEGWETLVWDESCLWRSVSVFIVGSWGIRWYSGELILKPRSLDWRLSSFFWKINSIIQDKSI